MIYIRHLGAAQDDTKKDFDAALIRTHALTLATEGLREAQVDLAHVDRITTIGRLTASIAPEVTQRIAAIVTNAQAARHFLDRRPPDLDEVREALDCIVREAYRASDVIYRIRGLLKEAPPKRERAEINAAIRDVIELDAWRGDEKRRISADAVRRAIAGCPSRLGATAASNPQFDYQRRRGNERHARRSTRIADLYRESGVKRRAGGGTRFGSGTGSEECGPPVRGLLHYQGPRHGHRFGRLPFHHRSARWATVGEGERALRRHLSIHIARPHGSSIVMGAETVTRRLMPA